MLFWLVLLGIYMGAVYPDKKEDIDGEPVEHDWYCPLPHEIPEMYQRDIDTPKSADAYVRSKQGGTPLTVKSIQDALRRLRE